MNSYKELDLLTLPLNGRNLIEASAGTGKTFTISNLYLRFILETDLAVKNILVVTFTDAATSELRDRIRKNLHDALLAAQVSSGDKNDIIQKILGHSLKKRSAEDTIKILKRAIISFDEASIFTIHGFCSRIISEQSFECSILFDTELLKDEGVIIKEIIDDFWRTEFVSNEAITGVVAERNFISPDNLYYFSKRLLSRPMLRIVPEGADSSHERLIDTYKSLKYEWERSREEIVTILQEDKGVKQGQYTYRKDRVQVYADDVTRIFNDAPSVSNLSSLDMFSASVISRSMKKGKTPPAHPFFESCDKLKSIEKEYIIWLKRKFFNYLCDELKKRKESKNLQSFDDLLMNVWNELSAEGGEKLADAVREKYKAVLVDEFQDTDPAQYNIFNTLFGKEDRSLFLIGDPKQSIYAFRGADIFSYITAAGETRKENKYTLGTNFRSETPLVKAVNGLYMNAQNPFVFGKAILYNPVGASEKSKGNESPLFIKGETGSNIVSWYIKKENPTPRSKFPSKEEARLVVIEAVSNEILRILNMACAGEAKIGDRPVCPSDFAILVLRNDDALMFKESLSLLNIPAVLTKTGSVFETTEAFDIELFLSAVASPGNIRFLNAALSTCFIGLGAEEICNYLENEADQAAYEIHMENFSMYHDMWSSGDFIRMFRTFLSDYQVREKLLSLPDGERKLTNVLHLAELIQKASGEQRLGINGLLSWFSTQRVDGEGSEEQELRLERDDEAVKIITVFKSKGLQYPIVFCPFMWQKGAVSGKRDLHGTFYHENGQQILDIDLENQEAVEKSELENLSELLRLLYVGLTRAQNRCYIACGKIGTPSATALDYILTGGSNLEDGLIKDLKNKVKNADMDALFQIFKDVTTPLNNGMDFKICEVAEELPYKPPQKETPASFAPRQFKRSIAREWAVTSYSSLVYGKKPVHDDSGRDLIKRDEPDEEFIEVGSESPKGFFAFPKGAVPGSCIHTIFEEIDFQESDAEKIKKQIQKSLINFGLDDKKLTPPIKNQGLDATFEMISNVLNTPLLKDNAGLKLKNIGLEDRLTELEFYYPLHANTGNILSTFFDYNTTENEYPEVQNKLTFSPVRGFMHGFIDLVLVFDGKYYIVDWKTNHLGNSYLDYTKNKLLKNMQSSFYDIQYHIYTVALHHYLMGRLPDYRYEKHFGGVFYLYLRGIHPDSPESGIFFARPPEKKIDELSRMVD